MRQLITLCHAICEILSLRVKNLVNVYFPNHIFLTIGVDEGEDEVPLSLN